ncbi:DUF6677 family protein [Calycomorphotria hydatis]|uniref:DUF6677 domain-containing protein n=1 Tax=Calycomorphotria hydatis TaxID=2528027 RepID=A0A517TBB9_9PLAN|nr:DUF6677 family protein [Calycomorphotria hydatis]QDT65664.1 hypothetical protein V22_29230 [Calycomorphotria hydatis]
MADATRKVDLKNRWLAAFLTLVLPGLGQLYQGRTFKGLVYLGCIVTLCLWGQAMGGWKVVHINAKHDQRGNLIKPTPRDVFQSYSLQFPAGVLTWPAMLQNSRYRSPENRDVNVLEEPLRNEFRGWLVVEDFSSEEIISEVEGVLSLGTDGPGGEFRGKTLDGEEAIIPISRLRSLEKPIAASSARMIQLVVNPADVGEPEARNAYLVGKIPRSFVDYFQAPLDKEAENELHLEFGSMLEIAFVFTWIAGLLNVLAIWDAFEGPAYGWGDEPELQRKRGRKTDNSQDTDSTNGDKPEVVESEEPATATSN